MNVSLGLRHESGATFAVVVVFVVEVDVERAESRARNKSHVVTESVTLWLNCVLHNPVFGRERRICSSSARSPVCPLARISFLFFFP